MEIFKNKFLVKLIAALCIILIIFNFTGMNKIYADDEAWGAPLINPIINLMTALGDAIMEILHTSIQSQDAAIIKISGTTSWLEKIGSLLGVIAGIVVAIAIIAAIVATGGLAAAAATALAAGAASATFTVSISAGAVAVGAIAGICVGVAVNKAIIPDDIYLPAFSITAEEIFSNEIALFDVNFFQPMPDKVVEGTTYETGEKEEKFYAKLTIYYEGSIIFGPEQISSEAAPYSLLIKGAYNENPSTIADMKKVIEGDADSANQLNAFNNIINKVNSVLTDIGQTNIVDVSSIIVSRNDDYTTGTLKTNVGTPSTGGAKEVKIVLDVTNALEDVTKTTEAITIVSTAKRLQEVISTWYFILRNIALLVLMLVLIYIGIRIVVGSTAGEKAKYKERLMDWVIALCLLFVMHYIMVFAVELVEKITDLVGKTVNGNAAVIYLTDEQAINAEKVLQGFNTTSEGDDDGDAIAEHYGPNGEDAIIWPTDLAGAFRIKSQLTEEGTSKWVGYSLCYTVLVLFTLFFAFTYLKRVLYMAFLTIIAPLVAMTYPIDKIADGKAQAFDAWLKEYIFNLMIQPLHLLLYTILVTSAYALASESPIYALVAIGFMMPAEKLMRRFFGFEKAKTPGLLGGAAGAALAMTGLQKMLGHKPHVNREEGRNGERKTTNQNGVKLSGKNNVNYLEGMAGGAPTEADKSSAQQNATNYNLAAPRDENNETMSGLGDDNTQRTFLMDPEEDDDATTFGIGDDNEQRTFLMNPEDDELVVGGSGEGAEGNSEEQPEIIELETDTPDTQPSDAEDTSRSEPKRHIVGAVGAVAGTVAKSVGRQILTGVHPMRLAGKVALGATAGTAGLLLGVASGDPNKAFQYTTAGAAAGSSLAGALSGNKISNPDEIKKAYEEAYYGEDYNRAMLEKQKEKFKADKENIKYLRQALKLKNNEEAEEVMRTTGEKCYSNGITDIDDIATIHQLTKGGMSFEKAAAAKYYATTRLPSNIDNLTGDKIKKYKETWQKEYEDKGYGERSKQLSEESFKAAMEYKKEKSGLTRIRMQ